MDEHESVGSFLLNPPKPRPVCHFRPSRKHFIASEPRHVISHDKIHVKQKQ